MRVDIEKIKQIQEERRKINSVDLDEIEFFENGVKLTFSKDLLSEFSFTGLNNIDFISTGYYKNNT